MAGKVGNEYGDGVAWVRGSMIGKGSFGRVYLANLKNPRSKYSFFPSVMAVKSAEVSASGSIQKEREVLSNLEGCPDHVIRCFGDETTTGNNRVMVYNLLLEYGSGGTLADRIKKFGDKGLPELEVRAYATSILRGLNHIHGVGYVHCDLKPDNVLLVANRGRSKITEFRAKIGDFGLAKRATQSKKRKLEPYWKGTPMYLSPEAVMDSVQDFPCDVWALGCIVLEMLTGKPPWDGELKTEELLGKIRAGQESPRVPNGVSKEARDFLKGCLVKNPMFRFTCEMLLNHPFVQGFDDHDDGVEEELDEVVDLNENVSDISVSDTDDEYSCGSFSEELSSCSSEEGADDVGDEFVSSSVAEEEAVKGPVVDDKLDHSKDVSKQISTPKMTQPCPVS